MGPLRITKENMELQFKILTYKDTILFTTFKLQFKTAGGDQREVSHLQTR